MWLFTETGFVSAVQHTVLKDTLMVRARDRESLVPLASLCDTDIMNTPNADYPYRVVATKDMFGKWVSDSIDFLDYSNYKSQVAVTRGKSFAHTLGSVWSIMHDVEDSGARGNAIDYDAEWDDASEEHSKALS